MLSEVLQRGQEGRREDGAAPDLRAGAVSQRRGAEVPVLHRDEEPRVHYPGPAGEDLL